jgi:predicted CXXCH cytochrome family protein
MLCAGTSFGIEKVGAELIPRAAEYILSIAWAGLALACLLGAGDAVAAAAADRRADGAAAARPETCSAGDCHPAIKRFGQVHPPVEEDQCELCHKPKAGATPFAAGLRHEFERAAGNAELCYECHDRLDEEAHTHEPVGQGLCVLCHDPHGAERAALLRMAPDRALCMQCHRADSLEGDHVHEPVAEGKCGECHEYHGGDHRRLLRGEFTAELYEPFDLRRYELCYGCHESDQVTESVTTTATGFRNGDVNLHFIHVNREEKGRTCNVCHQMHASMGPHLVNETTPFGTWQLPLNYRPTETGGSCLPGCHRRKGYDRVKPLQNE